MVWMECAIWELANLVFIKFSFLCEMDESNSRFRIPKTFHEEMVCVIMIIYGLQEQMGVVDFSRMARPKSEQDLHH